MKHTFPINDFNVLMLLASAAVNGWDYEIHTLRTLLGPEALEVSDALLGKTCTEGAYEMAETFKDMVRESNAAAASNERDRVELFGGKPRGRIPIDDKG